RPWGHGISVDRRPARVTLRRGRDEASYCLSRGACRATQYGRRATPVRMAFGLAPFSEGPPSCALRRPPAGPSRVRLGRRPAGHDLCGSSLAGGDPWRAFKLWLLGVAASPPIALWLLGVFHWTRARRCNLGSWPTGPVAPLRSRVAVGDPGRSVSARPARARPADPSTPAWHPARSRPASAPHRPDRRALAEHARAGAGARADALLAALPGSRGSPARADERWDPDLHARFPPDGHVWQAAGYSRLSLPRQAPGDRHPLHPRGPRRVRGG